MKPTPTQSPSQAQPFTILLTDDDAGDRLLASEAMEEARVLNPVLYLEDGEELMAYLQSHCADFRGLILLDLNMPRKGGREVLAEMKADPALQEIPVVILTTSQAEEDRAQVRALGADGFISKPVTFDGMVQVLKTLEQYGVQFGGG